MPKTPVQKTTFGELEPGDVFVNSASKTTPKSNHDHVAKEGSILNLKIEAVGAGANGVCLEDGRPRTFHNEETVYKTHHDGHFEPGAPA